MDAREKIVIVNRLNECISRIRHEGGKTFPDFETCADDVSNMLFHMLEWVQRSPRGRGKSLVIDAIPEGSERKTG